MRRIQRAGLVGLGLVIAAAIAGSGQPSGPAAGAGVEAKGKATGTDPLVAAVVERHNSERAEAGLDPLEPNPKLTAAAEAHARDMAARTTMSHEGGDGSDPARRIEAAGYRGRSVGENVAAGQETPSDVVDAWMDSPPHRANILGTFGEIGVARVVGPDDRPYWCVTFGRPWPSLDPAKAASGLIAALNAARAEADRSALAADAALNDAALRHARDLAARDALGPAEKRDESEAEPEKAEPPRFPRIDGPRRRSVALSVTTGPTSPGEAIEALLGDEEQAENLRGDYRSVGAGYARTEEGRPYWVLLLARP